MTRPETGRLLLDAMLGKLATYLRMCGYDAAYALEEGLEADEGILVELERSERTLLTRDRELAGRAPDAVLLHARGIGDQLRELAEAGFALELAAEPSRCGACNGVLEALPDGSSTPEYAPDPAATPVWRCSSCGQYFWRGSHWDDVAETLDDLR